MFNIIGGFNNLDCSDLNIREKLFFLLGRLDEYAAYHFATEEEYFLSHGYPDSEDHIHEHHYYIDTCQLLYRDCYKCKSKEDYQVFIGRMESFLIRWWFHHISEKDVEYASFIKNKK
ncbi:bacteriohemerythrin [Dongshaea marina]|uniref:bacteriohemerythrin n=1 Tax=Dongshaea marina TaxID=2047966 RepID=UPI000D3EB465